MPRSQSGELALAYIFFSRVHSSNMVTTKIINETNSVITLKEGNVGVFYKLSELPKKGSLDITVDPNATYREYLVGCTPNDKQITLSSDELIDNEKIRIKANNDGTLRAEGFARRHAEQNAEVTNGTWRNKAHKFFQACLRRPQRDTETPC